MGFTDIFVRRPVLATVVSLLILFIGLRAMFALPVRQYPRTENAVVTVTTLYYGADPDVVAGFITQPLEAAIAQANGIDYITSTSANSLSTITVNLRLNYDYNRAVTEITSKISSVLNRLPPQSQQPSLQVQVGQAVSAMYLGFRSEVLQPNQITDYLVRVVQPKLQAVQGVQTVTFFGARNFALRAWLDPAKLAAYSLTASDVNTALAANDFISGLGNTKGQMVQVNMTASTGLHSLEEFQQLVVKQERGAVVRLSDVATVVLGAEDYETNISFNGLSSIGMAIDIAPDANLLDVMQRVQAVFPDIQSQLPEGLQGSIVYDASRFVTAAISEVEHTITETLVIVMLVVFIFLGSLRSVIIPIVAIPLSLVGAFTMMLALGFSINLLSLLAMVLAIGLVVDDAIVMLENIFRHVESGMPRREAAITGAREIGFAIVAMTLTLASVFAPLAFATGRTGRLFIEFALTLAGAVLVSGFIALTLSPMMCSLLLKHEEKHSWLFNLIEGWLEAMTNGYRRALTAVLHARWVVAIGWLAVLCAGAVLFMSLKAELAPIEDRGVVFGVVTAPQGSTPQYTADQIKPIEQFYAQIPEAAAWTAISGFPTVVDGNAVLRLKPWEERKKRQQQIADELRPKFQSVPGAIAFPLNPPSLGQSFRSTPVEFVIMSQIPYPDLQRLVDRFLDEARKYPGVQNLQTDLRLNTPEVRVRINRDKLSDIGVPVDTVGRTLETMLGGRQVTRFKREGEQYDVIVQVAPIDRTTPADISDSYVRARDGSMVQLSNLVDVKEGVAPQSLNHFNRLRAVKVTATLAPGYAIDEALRAMDAAAKATLPVTAQTDVDGQSREFRKSGKEIYFTFVLALAFIYLVLSAQFESFVHPFVIMLSVPLSMTGALFMLWLTGGTLNIYSQVGLVTLVGLITKHGILIVEFSNQLRAKGEDLMDAVVDAATLRLRPILMTTGAMVLGALPLALAHGAGAESRTQIGWVIVGGMTFGTLLTLFVVPTAYTLLAGRAVHHEPASVPTPAAPLPGAPVSGHAD